MRALTQALLLVLMVAAPMGCTPALLLERDAQAAYTQGTVTITRARGGDHRCVEVAWTETEAGAATEATIGPLDWTHGTIVEIHFDRTAGTGATMNPKIGRATGWSTTGIDHILTATATADPIHEQGVTHYYSASGKLFVVPTLNAGSDNSVTANVKVCEGWL